jgi:hypothetical protein
VVGNSNNDRLSNCDEFILTPEAVDTLDGDRERNEIDGRHIRLRDMYIEVDALDGRGRGPERSGDEEDDITDLTPTEPASIEHSEIELGVWGGLCIGHDAGRSEDRWW